MITIKDILLVSVALFFSGIFGLLYQSHIIRLLLAIESILISALFLFVGIAINNGNDQGFFMFLIIISMAAAEVGVALAIIFSYHKLNKANI